MTNARQDEMRILPDDILGGITDDETQFKLARARDSFALSP
jgi:hypothetical protein